MRDLYERITTYLRQAQNYDPLIVAAQMVLIGVVVWWVLRFLRGTRGARLLKGTALLLASAYVAIRLLPQSDEWKRIEFLFGNFLLFAFVAAVVAFQPEVRRALLQIGQARFLRSARGQAAALISALVESASYLSRKKIGAVIAVERTDGLAALAQTGTALDAKLTPPLLSTIFYPGTPLHDMGVIISGGRIVAARCQFPLAESEDADPSLGSRHRAALGLAQDCDAVVLVVSEETGRISLACDGQLYLGLEMTQLREMLRGLLAPATASRGRSKKPARKTDD